MLTSANLSILFFSIFASITFNGFFRNIAKTNNILIDIPEKSRKFHDRATPLTGGISTVSYTHLTLPTNREV